MEIKNCNMANSHFESNIAENQYAFTDNHKQYAHESESEISKRTEVMFRKPYHL